MVIGAGVVDEQDVVEGEASGAALGEALDDRHHAYPGVDGVSALETENVGTARNRQLSGPKRVLGESGVVFIRTEVVGGGAVTVAALKDHEVVCFQVLVEGQVVGGAGEGARSRESTR